MAGKKREAFVRRRPWGEELLFLFTSYLLPDGPSKAGEELAEPEYAEKGARLRRLSGFPEKCSVYFQSLVF
ncbi:MAG: hypothetical protein IJW67_04800 [Blautia sp.]|nr:hypothetical protein [Blautia sp.]